MINHHPVLDQANKPTKNQKYSLQFPTNLNPQPNSFLATLENPKESHVITLNFTLSSADWLYQTRRSRLIPFKISQRQILMENGERTERRDRSRWKTDVSVYVRVCTLYIDSKTHSNSSRSSSSSSSSSSLEQHLWAAFYIKVTFQVASLMYYTATLFQLLISHCYYCQSFS